MTTQSKRLVKHDGASEVFVCRDCMVQIDPVGATIPGYTKEDCDAGKCPLCGGDDTAWLFAAGGPIVKGQVDLVQGIGDDGERFGYVAGEKGGYFFTWKPTLEATLASVEEDEVDGDGGLDESEVVQFLEEYLPTTKRGREMWADAE